MKKNPPGECSVEWCVMPLLWKGFCEVHYTRNKRGWNMDKPFIDKHNMVKTPTHIAWTNMWQRTTNKKHRDYHYYGGRGIKVEDTRWLKFSEFYKDMGEKPKGLWLERINNDLGYSKENCKWATISEQMKNRRKFKRSIKSENYTAS